MKLSTQRYILTFAASEYIERIMYHNTNFLLASRILEQHAKRPTPLLKAVFRKLLGPFHHIPTPKVLSSQQFWGFGRIVDKGARIGWF